MTRRWIVVLLLVVVVVAVCMSVAAKEKQPHMQAALEHLQAARTELQAAEADKGGHREAAIKATDSAIEHTKEGIAYANKHH